MYLPRLAVCLAAIAVLAFAQENDIFARIRHAFPTPAEGERAAAELAHKNFAQVESLLAAQEPVRPAAIFALEGAVIFLAGDMPRAIEYFDRAARLAPLSQADSFTLAMALAKAGNDARARTVLTALSEEQPASALYVYWLGRLDYDQRRYQEAVAKLQRATELDPKAARAWDALGLAFDMQGRTDKALAAFERAGSLNRAGPHPSPWPPHNLGYLLLRMDRLHEAEAALRESLRYDPSLAVSSYHLARTLEKQGRDSEAIEEYKQAVAQDHGSSDACYSLAMLYRKLHRESEAQTMFAEYRRRKASPQ